MAPESAALRILVVDDEPIIANTLAIILESQGHSVRIAYSAEEAIEILWGFPPHALISDVMLPGMSGIQLADSVVQSCPDCKILLITGQRELAGRTRYSILEKPVPPRSILQFIDNCAATRM